MRRAAFAVMLLQIIIFQASSVWPQSNAIEPNVVKIEDVVTGKVEVHGRFGVKLGTPMRGKFHISGSTITDQEVEVATILGDMSKKFVYQVDPLYDTIKVVDHLQLSLDEREEYWFFEGMHSPGKPVDFPNGNGVIAHVGFFGHKLTLRILLPARKTVTLPVGNPATPKRVVAAEDLENGKCTVHGRLDSPLGKLLRGSIQVVTIESSNEWEIRVTTTNGKSATFKNSEVSLHRPGFGSIEDLNVLRKREQLADIDFYENASWSGVPKSLEGLLISQSYQEFACRSELVVCIP